MVTANINSILNIYNQSTKVVDKLGQKKSPEIRYWIFGRGERVTGWTSGLVVLLGRRNGVRLGCGSVALESELGSVEAGGNALRLEEARHGATSRFDELLFGEVVDIVYQGTISSFAMRIERTPLEWLKPL